MLAIERKAVPTGDWLAEIKYDAATGWRSVAATCTRGRWNSGRTPCVRCWRAAPGLLYVQASDDPAWLYSQALAFQLEGIVCRRLGSPPRV